LALVEAFRFAQGGTILKTRHQFVLTDEYIEDAQRLTIAQNKTLKLLYQTWWVWWLPRVVIAGVIIYCLLHHLESTAAVLGTFLVVHFWGQWFGRRTLAKARKNLRTKGSTSVVSMNDQGVDIDGAHGTSHLKWSAMLLPTIYPQGVLIKFSRLVGLWLPDHALTEGSPADVRKLLAENVKDSAANSE
jgi:hypothetical protein